MPLYHTSVYLPADLNLPRSTLYLRYGQHALKAAISDRYGRVKLPEYVDTYDAELIEVEVASDNNKIAKLVYRVSLDKYRDLCLVLIPEVEDFFVKTVWINAKRDKHASLDKMKYSLS